MTKANYSLDVIKKMGKNGALTLTTLSQRFNISQRYANAHNVVTTLSTKFYRSQNKRNNYNQQIWEFSLKCIGIFYQ